VRGGKKQPGNQNLPDIAPQPGSKAKAVIVLPHSEPLSEEQKAKAALLIDVFNLEIVTCFYSQTWSTRQAAIEKVIEQLSNLDQARRDSMSTEVNVKNLPAEMVFQGFTEFVGEGIKDPVLKIFIRVLELVQMALPIFFRSLQPTQLKKDLMPMAIQVIKKTSDLKQKVREAAVNFCLYLSHQSPIGSEVMVTQVLSEIEGMATASGGQQSAATNLGNSHLFASCLHLLNQYQQQCKIV